MANVVLRCIAPNPYPYNPGDTLALPRQRAAVLLASGKFKVLADLGETPDPLERISGLSAAGIRALTDSSLTTFRSVGVPDRDQKEILESLRLTREDMAAIRDFQEAVAGHEEGLDGAVKALAAPGDVTDIPGIEEEEAAKLLSVGLETIGDLLSATDAELKAAKLPKAKLTGLLAWLAEKRAPRP